MIRELPPEVGVYGRHVSLDNGDDAREWLESEPPVPGHVYAIMFFDAQGRNGPQGPWVEGEIRRRGNGHYYTAYTCFGYVGYVGYYHAKKFGLVRLSGKFAPKRRVNLRIGRGYEEEWLWKATKCELIRWTERLERPEEIIECKC
jgi:hypothetical protein